MYSAQKELEQLKQVYQQQEIPHGIKNEMIKRYSLEEQRFNQRVKRKKQVKGLILSFAIIAMMFSSIFFDNQIRSFAEDLPLIGPVVKLILGKTLSDEAIEIRVPQISTKDKENSQTIAGLNKKYFREGQENFAKAKVQYQDFKTNHFQVTGDYQKLLDDPRFLVIERKMTQTAADSYTEKRYDTIDKKSGVVLSLPLLFKDDQYLSVLTNEVKEQMQKNSKENPDQYYWTDDDFKDGLIKKTPLVTKDTKFYINRNHELVLVYDQFSIAPGYMGTPTFVIPKEVTRSILASPDYLNE
ncbi:RsiV family protein [Enterococcus hirae]|uniref:RsiV family protein n=1 Tax=Enterococcus hirae TaxID=1354 RepID=UPI000F705BCE|nr:RsiV family protein [Enterococcus hirae]MBA5270346.1 DUF3298 domain-containing protein [Enterococcus hirae]MDU4894533.1 RsiV family protein [Enterococcus hirae]NVM00310.1 DUF3298 domain-containing protein [Enterococcus hirae]VEE77701.1 Protein of uncharacterised function (DUF3298) [Enterococcus hirae]